MLQDKSEDWTDTWEFLDRRLSDLAKFGKNVRSVSTSVHGKFVFYMYCMLLRNIFCHLLHQTPLQFD